jgi:hypothetical protein
VCRTSLASKALHELGPRQLGLYALYQLGLRVGYFKWRTGDGRPFDFPQGRPLTEDHHSSPVIRHLLDLPDPDSIRAILGPAGLADLKAQADEIVEGQIRLFGGPLVPLNLTPPGELHHWTAYALGKSPFPNPQSPNYPIADIKFIWEPTRFGWAFTLGRAYHLTGDERYSDAFWRYYEIFSVANPINMGPNWISAQEVALRLIAFTFAAQIFAKSPHSNEPRTSHLAQSIAEHATRIPSTLIYARSQNNNHLLSETAALITASLAFPDHPRARRWAKLGWKWFNFGLEHQIDDDGTYIQQSTNYHRLMLQLALWVFQMQKAEGGAQKDKTPNVQRSTFNVRRFNAATRWLLALTDPESGHIPNLGPNDGAYILPLTILPFSDYRPVLQAASRAFLGEPAFEPGPWDELSLWLQAASRKLQVNPPALQSALTPNILTTNPTSWAYLRAAKFHDRPGHADQLHLDLWCGMNIAQDAGTYLYNADPPWDNALAHTAVHNTVMIDGCEQMTRAGRFLYLDRAQAEIIARETTADGSWERITARHDGYRQLGVMHQRSATAFRDGRWLIEDRLLPAPPSPLSVQHVARLHWLLPNWEYEIQNAEFGIRIHSPYGWISLDVQTKSAETFPPASCDLQLVRAGTLLRGSGPISPTWGWVSPTYGIKEPALSFAVTVTSSFPLVFTSEFIFPEHE